MQIWLKMDQKIKMIQPHLDISAELQSALTTNQAVVALESTIIAHGMPYPKNAQTALKVEETIRNEGAIPATIAIMNGKLKVGLSKEEIHHLGRQGKAVFKTSRRDIPFILAKQMDGATTVASTMIIAAMAGIKVFATGGIGGVHRKASQSMDISADLQELAQTNVAVVCAGAKSILDLELTLEYLETFGVPVIGYQTAEFPAFYSRKSGLSVDFRIDHVEELALAIKTKWDLGLKGGIVIANPIPEADQMAYESINLAIKRAIGEAEAKGVKGKAISSFLLAKIEELTGGKSLEANIKLVLNNAQLGAKLAREMG